MILFHNHELTSLKGHPILVNIFTKWYKLDNKKKKEELAKNGLSSLVVSENDQYVSIHKKMIQYLIDNEKKE